MGQMPQLNGRVCHLEVGHGEPDVIRAAQSGQSRRHPNSLIREKHAQIPRIGYKGTPISQIYAQNLPKCAGIGFSQDYHRSHVKSARAGLHDQWRPGNAQETTTRAEFALGGAVDPIVGPGSANAVNAIRAVAAASSDVPAAHGINNLRRSSCDQRVASGGGTGLEMRRPHGRHYLVWTNDGRRGIADTGESVSSARLT
jgi:hypothetical protein